MARHMPHPSGWGDFNDGVACVGPPQGVRPAPLQHPWYPSGNVRTAHGAIMSRTMRVTVKLFAAYRERAGKSDTALELPDGSTVGFLAQEMVRLYPGLPQDASRLVVAVNRDYRRHGHALQDGDEVALIPPVSGGAR